MTGLDSWTSRLISHDEAERLRVSADAVDDLFFYNHLISNAHNGGEKSIQAMVADDFELDLDALHKIALDGPTLARRTGRTVAAAYEAAGIIQTLGAEWIGWPVPSWGAIESTARTVFDVFAHERIAWHRIPWGGMHAYECARLAGGRSERFDTCFAVKLEFFVPDGWPERFPIVERTFRRRFHDYLIIDWSWLDGAGSNHNICLAPYTAVLPYSKSNPLPYLAMRPINPV